MADSTAPKNNRLILKPHWEMTTAEKVEFIGKYSREVWENKMNSETPDIKDKAAYQAYLENIEKAKRRDDPHGWR